MILSIDPGLRGCGVALWTPGGKLERAEYLRSEYVEGDFAQAVRAMAWTVEEWVQDVLDAVVIECPQTYGGRAQRGDTNDLVQLALIAGALSVMSGCQTRLVRPAEWKGQTPKDVTENQAKEKLTALELARVKLPGRNKKLASNVWDAVGIGLYYLESARVLRNVGFTIQQPNR